MYNHDNSEWRGMYANDPALRSKEKSGIKEKILIAFVCVLAFVFVTLLLNEGLNRSERLECLAWRNYSQQYAGFYLTEWQADQCLAHDITINAPIK